MVCGPFFFFFCFDRQSGIISSFKFLTNALSTSANYDNNRRILAIDPGLNESLLESLLLIGFSIACPVYPVT